MEEISHMNDNSKSPASSLMDIDKCDSISTLSEISTARTCKSLIQPLIEECISKVKECMNALVILIC